MCLNENIILVVCWGVPSFCAACLHCIFLVIIIISVFTLKHFFGDALTFFGDALWCTLIHSHILAVRNENKKWAFELEGA